MSDILDLLANGLTAEEILNEMPDLEADDVKAALQYASKNFDHPVSNSQAMRSVGFLSIVFLTLAFATVCFAQHAKTPSKVPDFSGRWLSETVKAHSDSRPMSSMADSNLKIEMVVVQSGNELKVKESTTGSRGSHSRESVYYLDGSGESNKGFTDGFVYESKTGLKDQKLIIEATIRFANSKGSLFHTEEWELSNDGKTLTIRTKNAGSTPGSSPVFPRSLIRHEKIFRLAS